MLKFEEVKYMFKLDSYADGRVLGIRTDKGNAHVDRKKMKYYPFTAGDFSAEKEIIFYFMRDGDTLYLMKKEPQFYA